jgi:transposase
VKGWPMYQELQQLKEMGLNKSQVQRQLGIDWKTVDRYWEVTPDEFAEIRKNTKRTRKLEKYEEQIVRWLQEHPDMSSAQIQDWLKQHYLDYQGKERTLRRFIRSLRIQYNIKKPVIQRQYQAVEELPMGYQAQVDLGFTTLVNTQGQRVKLTGFGLVLSHSRYKYVEWDDKPLTAARFIQVHYRAFEYIGGVPEEIVYDQDRLLAINENFGDIIYTAEFERFRQQMGFKIYLCRKSDPETKGKIEAVIKYAKGNYARHRIFDNIQAFNQGCI